MIICMLFTWMYVSYIVGLLKVFGCFDLLFFLALFWYPRWHQWNYFVDLYKPHLCVFRQIKLVFMIPIFLKKIILQHFFGYIQNLRAILIIYASYESCDYSPLHCTLRAEEIYQSIWMNKYATLDGNQRRTFTIMWSLYIMWRQLLSTLKCIYLGLANK